MESHVERGLHELARANQGSHRIQMLQDSLLSIENAILILDEMVENGTDSGYNMTLLQDSNDERTMVLLELQELETK